MREQLVAEINGRWSKNYSTFVPTKTEIHRSGWTLRFILQMKYGKAEFEVLAANTQSLFPGM